MGLSTIIYLISTLDALRITSIIFIAVLLIILVLASLAYDEAVLAEHKDFWVKGCAISFIGLLISILLAIVVPTEKTMYMMLGAHMNIITAIGK